MKAIIFDFDGTLYSNKNPLKNVIDQRTYEFLRIKGIEDIESLEQKIPNILETLDYFCLDREEFINFVYSDLAYDYLKKDQILVTLLKKIPCPKILISLAPSKHLLTAMERLEISYFFDEIISICENKKDIYYCILKKNNWEPNNVICIGDSYKIDLEPAKQLGMTIFLCADQEANCYNTKSFSNINECLSYVLNSKI